jgi:hypothetical protein
MKTAPISDLSTLRLQLLGLVHRHDQAPEAVIGRAAALEAWVLRGRGAGAPEADKPKGPAAC